jgi:hypothetical protein
MDPYSITKRSTRIGAKQKAASQAMAARVGGCKDLIGGITVGCPPLDTRYLA